MKKYIIFILAIFISTKSIYGQLQEGELYREKSKPEVYLLQDGKMIWIPSQESLFALGYQWNNVHILNDGLLQGYNKFTIPSDSKTPSSLIFLPDYNNQVTSTYQSHYAIKVNTSTRILARKPKILFYDTREIQLVEIRGWLANDPDKIAENGTTGSKEGNGFDAHLNLIPDYSWLKDKGIDLNKIIQVGNIVVINDGNIKYGTDAFKMVSIPLLHVELNSWLWRDRIPLYLPQSPLDWVKVDNVTWPFLFPYLKKGDYIKIYGSLVRDGGHPSDSGWGNRIGIWETAPFQNVQHPNHFAGWSEIHPPDKIELIDKSSNEYKPLVETTYGLTLCAEITKTNKIEINLSPEVSKPTTGTWKVAYEEILGPECINAGGDFHYTKVEKFNDYIKLTACTSGGGPLSSTPGRIRALYRLWWEKIPLVNLSGNASWSSSPMTNRNVKFLIKAVDDQNHSLNGEVYYNNIRVGSTNSPFMMAKDIPYCSIIGGASKKVINCPSKKFKFNVKINSQNYVIDLELKAYNKAM